MNVLYGENTISFDKTEHFIKKKSNDTKFSVVMTSPL